MNDILNMPVFFEKNRVGRVYTGGALFADFFGDNSTDGHMPEEWIASAVSAQKGNVTGNPEGISKVLGTNIPFNDFLSNYKEELLGSRDCFDVLTKVLDSAIRLPVQAHPDKAFSRKYFNSEYGKTEMWLILATRKDAKIYLGFKDGVTRKQFENAIDASEHDSEAMPALLNEIPVRPGDVFLIPAKMIHAIGAGCLVLEAQEPTDFTIEPEAWCGDYRLNEKEMFMGLDRETAIDCFDFSLSREEALKKARPVPYVIESGGGFETEALISYDHTDCFAVKRHLLDNCKGFTLKSAPAVFIVTEGNGIISGENYSKNIKKGDYFFLPHISSKKFTASTEGRLVLAEILPSMKGE